MALIRKINANQETVVMIDGWLIKQDKEGRYCLNDLHKAAGGAHKHAPTKWQRNDASAELIEKLEGQICPTKALYVRKGRGITGTYAVKELVYAYAMWISAEYHLKVIRAYVRLAYGLLC